MRKTLALFVALVMLCSLPTLASAATISRSGNLLPSDTIGADLDTAVDNGWAITDTVGGLSVANGVMTFEPASAALTQAIKTFGTTLNQTFVSEFSVRLTYEDGVAGNFGVQIYNGKYRSYLQIAPATVKIQQYKGSNSFVTCSNASESGVWYNYYVSQTAGHVTVLRKAADESEWTILGSNLPIPAMTGNASFKAYIGTVGLKCELKDVTVNKVATSPIDDTVVLEAQAADTEDFSEADIADTAWSTTSAGIYLDSDMLHVTANGATAAQSISRSISDFGKSVIDFKYCINATTAAGSKSLSVAVMNKTNRGVISIYPNQMTLRGAAGNNWYTVSNVASEVGSDTWYDLRMVMELYDEDTADYRYSVYRKLTTDSDYECLAYRIPMPAFTSAHCYINLFVEADAAADVAVDDFSITPYYIDSANNMSLTDCGSSGGVLPGGNGILRFVTSAMVPEGKNVDYYGTFIIPETIFESRDLSTKVEVRYTSADENVLLDGESFAADLGGIPAQYSDVSIYAWSFAKLAEPYVVVTEPLAATSVDAQ